MKRRDFLKSIAVVGAGAWLCPGLMMGKAAEAAWKSRDSLPWARVRPTFLRFGELTNREVTDAIVVHHIGNTDKDVSAATVHRWHQQNGWSGIGYHYLIRKDGTIEQGRPRDTVGAHCYGENWHTVGVNIVGNFEEAEPGEAQLDSAKRLLASLCAVYGLAPGRDTIFGHRDFNATACPGENLYARLPELIAGTAAVYRGGR